METNDNPTASTRRKIWILGAGALVLLATCVLVFSYGRRQVSTSLGPALVLPVRTPSTRSAPASNGVTAASSGAAAAQAGLAVNDPEARLGPARAIQRPVCRGPESMLVLAVGADSNDYLYGLSDVIRIARLDFVEPSITVVSLPRDLWVEIPGIDQPYGYTHGKLNQAYFFGGSGMGYYDGPAGGPGLLALTIYHNYGLAVDHYFATHKGTAVKFVDALGGLDLDLPADVDGGTLDGSPGLGYFPAGPHHFDGQTALRFASVRMKYSDFQRQDNQSLVLLALRERLLSPSVLPKLPALVKAFQETILTDLSIEQLGQMACLLGMVGQEKIVLTQLPKGTYTVGTTYSDSLKGNTSVVQADPDIVAGYLERFAQGQWPEREVNSQ
jgi:LCP family protein required for cell wall assembly